MTPPPTPVWRCKIEVDGDTRQDMLRQLLDFVSEIKEGSNGPMAAGGGGRSGNVSITHDPNKTPEQYRQELLDWCERRRGKAG